MERHFHRRNLPHLYYDKGFYFITSNLANSIPIEFLRKLKYTSRSSDDIKSKRLFKKYDTLLHLDEYGEKYLLNSFCAEMVKYTIHYPDGNEYKLICYCIMPNHFHLVIELLPDNKGISKIMQSIKRISATECNRFLNRKGKFWQDESYDRLIRDERELYNVINYVLLNRL
jgi:REP element-mobilizing transposase RayT